MQAAEKKRQKEEKDIVNRLRPFARLQTSEDYEIFVADILCMSECFRMDPVQCITIYRRGHSSETNTGTAALQTDGTNDSC